ncbi:phylloplanin-like, partial [Oryza brachyantha]|uniref:phylloplanin-like n=1 Tax=Oryza brachyantha TaxID=4533 RepID=UPI001ADA9A5B
SLLLVLAVAATAAAVGIAPHGAEAAAGRPAVTGLVTGVVPCSAGSSINVASVPAFPNAGVQMMCGSRVVGGATADGTGAFTINMGTLNTTMLMAMAGNQCKVVVTTPLAACDASLAGVAGTLTAPVQLLGGSSGAGGLGGLGSIIALVAQILSGLLGEILNIVPLPFSLV